nr:MAG TPA: hypothetical protein [Caudoviricetes sp.]
MAHSIYDVPLYQTNYLCQRIIYHGNSKMVHEPTTDV